MTNKFYKVIKENPMWEVGAILEFDSSLGTTGGYEVIDEIFYLNEKDTGEYLSAAIIENQPTFFERVYKVNLEKKTVFTDKEEAKKLITDSFKK